MSKLLWLLKAHLPCLAAVDAACFDPAWTVEDFGTFWENRCHLGIIAANRDQVVGYVLFDIRERSLHVSRLAVLPDYQRRGIGRALISAVMGRLTRRRCKLVIDVPESCLAACQLLKSLTMPCKLIRDGFGDEDAIRFKLNVGPAIEAVEEAYLE